jgi:hypothetical protein
MTPLFILGTAVSLAVHAWAAQRLPDRLRFRALALAAAA